jgi:hypothetical protein
LVAYFGQTIKLRSSVLLGNAGVGFLYSYASGSTLDIGTATDPGNDTFGTATVATRNGKAGLRLCNSGAAGSLPADGDLWSVCPPVQTSLACDGTLGAYSDIVYGATSTVVAPVAVGSCTTGP